VEFLRRDFLKRSLPAVPLAILPRRCRPAAGDKPISMKDVKISCEPAYLKAEREGRLVAVESELWEMLSSCRLCPRRCGANRLGGDTGFCSSSARLKVSSYGPHFGEERPLVGNGGSGTVFFSHCNLLCCFCQNWQINHRGDGTYITHRQLADMMLSLQRRGCHNINLVTPTHVVPHIIKALRLAIRSGLKLPLVYNNGGYDSPEVIQKLDGIVDIYLPDFKYQDGALAAKYSSGAEDYPEVAAAGIKEMHRQVGVLRTDPAGIAWRGLIIRHLVMPQNIAGTDRFVQWVAKDLALDTRVNLMAQYRPEHRAFEYPELSRSITASEWEQARAWARTAGLIHIQGY
jgi:putative pyruvate formate lyase activating enzyme